jgi:RNA polymerase sigma-70 factor (ECF subfamily)
MIADTIASLEKARQGDKAVLGQLLESHRHYLRLLAKMQIGRQLQGKVDASDVVQEAFLDAHRYFDAFRGTSESQFACWLREILAGTLANVVRRYLGTLARNVRMERSIAVELNQSSHNLGQLLADPRTSPSERVMEEELSLQIAEALSHLSEDYQTVIVLRHLEGLTFPQIAERMGRSVDSVEKLWLRSVTRLRQSFRRPA